jgi:hypothetical protein
MLWIFLLACGDTAGTSSKNWTGGQFEMYTLQVEDSCFDGAMEVLFMPGGPGTPHAFEFPVYLPGFDELPLSYDVSLREPFVSIPITIEREDEQTMSGSGQIDSVLLNPTAYGDCEATLGVQLLLTPISEDTLDGTATINMVNLRGEEDRCPVPAADPCQIDLSLFAQVTGL